jgi:hypothetical protein
MMLRPKAARSSLLGPPQTLGQSDINTTNPSTTSSGNLQSHFLEDFPSSWQGTIYLVDWKGNLPVGKVHPLLTGRENFQLARYMYLVDWKGFLPAGEVQWVDSEKSGCLFWIPEF